MAMVEGGEVKPETLYVKWIGGNKNRSGGWPVTLEKDGKEVASRSAGNVNDIPVGTAVVGYRFGDEYLIPRFDEGPRGVHWVFVGVGFLPVWVFGVVVLVRLLRRARAGRTTTIHCRAEWLWAACRRALSRCRSLLCRRPLR